MIPVPDTPGVSENVSKLNETFSPKTSDMDSTAHELNVLFEPRRSTRKLKQVDKTTVFPANDSMIHRPSFRKSKMTPKLRRKAPIASPEIVDTPLRNDVSVDTSDKKYSPLLLKTPGSAIKKSIRKTHLMQMNETLTEKKNVTFHSPANMEMSILEIDEKMQSEQKSMYFKFFVT